MWKKAEESNIFVPFKDRHLTVVFRELKFMHLKYLKCK